MKGLISEYRYSKYIERFYSSEQELFRFTCCQTTDLGFTLMADGIESVLREKLEKAVK